MTSYEQLVIQMQATFQGTYMTGKPPVPLCPPSKSTYQDQVNELVKQIKQADYVVVGGASGLSAAGGGDFYYTDTPSYYEHFGKFAKRYGLKGAFSGMQYPFQTQEKFWGYLATFLYTTQHASIRKLYEDLKAILKHKNFYVVTTNQDTQFIKTFDESKVAEIQGDHRFFQCSKQCTDQIWDAVQPVEAMVQSMGPEETAIPTELIPKCPNCGAEAFPWVRGYGNFLEGERYQKEYAKISEAIETHQQEHILFLELGVGRITPMFIQEPFWNLTLSLPHANYASVNRDYAYLPVQIGAQGIAIQADIAQVLTDVREQLNSEV